MKYDIAYLTRKLAIGERFVEKVCRISDVLYEISLQDFLHKRLALYGGSALNLIYFKDIPRLSVDLDFNYRQFGSEDWGNVRNEIDDRLKIILKDIGYSDIAIQPTYPLLRMEIFYKNISGARDSFKIEIGYMRRMPVLRNDAINKFFHIGKEEYFPILTPQKEELFANKHCTMLYRGSGRDLFDAYQITKQDMNLEIFRKCLVIDSLMGRGLKLHEIDIADTIDTIRIDENLKTLLRKRDMLEELKNEVTIFTAKVIQAIESKEKDAINNFYDKKTFTPELIGKEIFHPHIKEHPAIKWALQNL